MARGDRIAGYVVEIFPEHDDLTPMLAHFDEKIRRFIVTNQSTPGTLFLTRPEATRAVATSKRQWKREFGEPDKALYNIVRLIHRPAVK